MQCIAFEEVCFAMQSHWPRPIFSAAQRIFRITTFTALLYCIIFNWPQLLFPLRQLPVGTLMRRDSFCFSFLFSKLRVLYFVFARPRPNVTIEKQRFYIIHLSVRCIAIADIQKCANKSNRKCSWIFEDANEEAHVMPKAHVRKWKMWKQTDCL